MARTLTARVAGRLSITMTGQLEFIFLSLTQPYSPRSTSHFGHDKSLEIKPYAKLPDGERPVLLYAGDGVSDLSAAAETDLLFAKEGKGICVHPGTLFPR